MSVAILLIGVVVMDGMQEAARDWDVSEGKASNEPGQHRAFSGRR